MAANNFTQHPDGRSMSLSRRIRRHPVAFAPKSLAVTIIALFAPALFLLTLGATPNRSVNLSGVPLLDTRAGVRTLADAANGAKATVVLFVGRVCPIANKYAPTMARMAAEYGKKGVRFVLVYSNPGETAANVAEHRRAYNLLTCDALVDTRQLAAKTLGATHTPQAVVLTRANPGGTFEVRYSGRIDDGFAARGVRTRVLGHHDLRDALNATLNGKPVKTPRTAVVGCLIESVGSNAPLDAPTYASSVAKILNENCVSCHREGEVAPMRLDSYAYAKRWAKNIAQVTQSKYMPPWKPVAGHGDFAGERRLSSEEIQTLLNWAATGAPAGDLATAPTAPKFADGWALGKPDLVLKMEKAWTVNPKSPDDYRCFVLPTNLAEDKDIVAVEYRAGNRKIVHHIIGYVDVNGEGRAKDLAESGDGYTSFGGPGFMPFGEMGGWVPGAGPQKLPDGVARKLPAGSDLVLQMHYSAQGKPETDITTVGLYFAKTPVRKHLRILPVIAPVNIPAGAGAYKTAGSMPVPFDAQAIFVAGHMHLLGRTIRIDAALPDGKEMPLMRIDDWDFSWQGIYDYKTPIRLPKGSRLKLAATFDNSASNPRNPSNPPKNVGWGEATTDEMCIGLVGFIAENENDPILRLLDGMRQQKGKPGMTEAEGRKRLRGIFGGDVGGGG